MVKDDDESLPETNPSAYQKQVLGKMVKKDDEVDPEIEPSQYQKHVLGQMYPPRKDSEIGPHNGSHTRVYDAVKDKPEVTNPRGLANYIVSKNDMETMSPEAVEKIDSETLEILITEAMEELDAESVPGTDPSEYQKKVLGKMTTGDGIVKDDEDIVKANLPFGLTGESDVIYGKLLYWWKTMSPSERASALNAAGFPELKADFDNVSNWYLLPDNVQAALRNSYMSTHALAEVQLNPKIRYADGRKQQARARGQPTQSYGKVEEGDSSKCQLCGGDYPSHFTSDGKVKNHIMVPQEETEMMDDAGIEDEQVVNQRLDDVGYGPDGRDAKMMSDVTKGTDADIANQNYRGRCEQCPFNSRDPYLSDRHSKQTGHIVKADGDFDAWRQANMPGGEVEEAGGYTQRTAFYNGNWVCAGPGACGKEFPKKNDLDAHQDQTGHGIQRVEGDENVKLNPGITYDDSGSRDGAMSKASARSKAQPKKTIGKVKESINQVTYKCDLCNKDFVDEGDYIIHNKTHTQEAMDSPYQLTWNTMHPLQRYFELNSVGLKGATEMENWTRMWWDQLPLRVQFVLGEMMPKNATESLAQETEGEYDIKVINRDSGEVIETVKAANQFDAELLSKHLSQSMNANLYDIKIVPAKEADLAMEEPRMGDEDKTGMTNQPKITPEYWWDNMMSPSARNSILDQVVGDSVPLSQYRKYANGRWSDLPSDIQEKVDRLARSGGGYESESGEKQIMSNDEFPMSSLTSDEIKELQKLKKRQEKGDDLTGQELVRIKELGSKSKGNEADWNALDNDDRVRLANKLKLGIQDTTKIVDMPYDEILAKYPGIAKQLEAAEEAMPKACGCPVSTENYWQTANTEQRFTMLEMIGIQDAGEVRLPWGELPKEIKEALQKEIAKELRVPIRENNAILIPLRRFLTNENFAGMDDRHKLSQWIDLATSKGFSGIEAQAAYVEEVSLQSLLKQAAMDGVITDPKGHRLEPDAAQCGQCGWKNPLPASGLI